MANILYGTPIREKIKTELIEKIKSLPKKPCLAVLQVGDREDSNVYIKNKVKFAEEIGAEVRHLKIEEWKNGKIEEEIKKLNEDESIDGIIVQLPLPEGMDTEKILGAIKKEKDAEPATARAVLAVLDFYNIEYKNKKVAIVGQGILAGKSVADVLENLGAEVFRCDINTKNIPEVTKKCDILISAVGKAGLIKKEFVRMGQVVVDVGFDRDKNGKLCGDVLFEEVKPIVSAVTPVPGGVGLVTVACLFQNLVDLCYHRF